MKGIWTLSWPYGIGINTVYKIVEQTIHAIDKTVQNISFTKTEEEFHLGAEKFRRLRRSPMVGIIGALDGIEIESRQRLQKDASNARKYYNWKGLFTLVVQAVASTDYKFSFVSVKHAGRTHDSTAIHATKMYMFIIEGWLPTWAITVCDDAYRNEPHLLTPIQGRIVQYGRTATINISRPL